MPRRSLRVQARAQTVAVRSGDASGGGEGEPSAALSAAESSIAAVDSPSPSPEPEVRCRASKRKPVFKDGTRRVRGKRGSLHSMVDMPLDILFEIFSHLRPLDLLNLSRTTKDIRAFMMKRSSAPFWRAACQNVDGLPPCPADLSEPAYANLMFDAHCHNCLVKNCQNVFWDCRMRLCKKCYNLLGIHPYTHMCIGQHWYTDVLPVLSNGGVAIFVRTQMEALKEEIKGMDPAALESALLAKKEALLAIKASSVAMDDWFYGVKKARSNDLDELREGRKAAIRAKLAELGWQPELDYIQEHPYRCGSEFMKLPEVRKAQALTPRIWRNIETRILGVLSQIRVMRLEEETRKQAEHRRVALDKALRLLSPPLRSYHLSVLEVAICIPEIRDYLEHHVDEFDAGPLEELVQTLVPTYAEARLKNCRAYLEGLVRKEIHLSDDVDILSLAVATCFQCELCNTFVAFPQLLWHRCDKRTWRPGDDDSYYRIAQFHLYNQVVWMPKHFTSMAAQIAGLVRLYGLDPALATAQDMDDSDVRVACTNADHAKGDQGQRIIHTWRSVRFWPCGFADSTCTFMPIPEAQAAVARPLSVVQARKDRLQYEQKSMWACARCSAAAHARSPKSFIEAHLKTEHKIEEPGEDDCVDCNNQVMLCAPVFLVPSELKESGNVSWSGPVNTGIAAYFDFE